MQCVQCNWVGEPDEDWEGTHRQAHEAAGFVGCDQFCGAKDNPQTPEEYVLAYLHWRRHTYLHGCAHGR